MKIALRYHARYRYAECASFSPHVARLFPRQEPGTRIDRMDFATDRSADVQIRRDLFDNVVAVCYFPEPRDVLDFRLELDLSIAPKDPFHFLLDAHATEMPFRYSAHEEAALTPYLRLPDDLCALPPELCAPSAPRPTVDALVAMNFWIHKNLAYERREEGDPLLPAETLRRGQGSCRDFAVLFAEVLRRCGVAARLASGFLWEDGNPGGPHVAANALHAWVEGCLPGAGWVGFDPTNGVLTDHHFLPAAAGLVPADIAPISGHYFGDNLIPSTLDAKLTVSPLP